MAYNYNLYFLLLSLTTMKFEQPKTYGRYTKTGDEAAISNL